MKALSLFFYGDTTAVGFSVIKSKKREPNWEEEEVEVPTLVLHWHGEKRDGVNLFPVKMVASEVFPMVKRWLEDVDRCGQPDHDGNNETGFIVFCDSWGQVDGMDSAFVGIQPHWAEYGE